MRRRQVALWPHASLLIGPLLPQDSGKSPLISRRPSPSRKRRVRRMPARPSSPRQSPPPRELRKTPTDPSMTQTEQLAPKIVQQLAVFLENKPGALAMVCDALAAAKINIFGLSVSDTTDHSVVRMVVSNSEKAIGIFEEHGALVVENDVLMIQNDNKPGSLSRIARSLAAKKINIDYGYLASMPSAKRGLLILRVTDPKKALAVLKKLDSE